MISNALAQLKKSVFAPRPQEPVFANEQTYIPLADLGRTSPRPPFAPTYQYRGPYINKTHAQFATCPMNGAKIDVGIRGSLRREDALKLYELGYFSGGDVLELGCNHGLSTSILAGAIRDSGGGRHIDTVDLVPKYADATTRLLQSKRLSKYATANAADAVEFCERLLSLGKSYSLAFVDHSHSRDLVYEATTRVVKLLEPGGLCLFHDYNDPRNPKPEFEEYGVAQGAMDAVEPANFAFYGIFGCTALFRKPLA